MAGERLASFVMPVRDAAGTLERAIESCLAQDEPRLECLLVLNGCRDDSPRIARAIAAADGRLRLLESPAAAGIVGALNVGWRAARAETIVRMDADDFSHPGRLRAQLDFLERHPDHDAVACGVRLAGALGEGMRRYVEWVNGLADAAAISRERFVESPVVHPAVAIRRRALERLGGYRDEPWAEDHDLWLRLLEAGGRIGRVGERLLDWSDSPARLTRCDPRYAPEAVWRMKARHLARLPRLREHGAVLGGAGPIGKTLARLLREEGARVLGFFDVHPRRIGQKIHGLEVAAGEEIGRRWREAALLAAVGVAGGRDELRRVARAADLEEGRDFWCVC